MKKLVLVLILAVISISKSFGSVNNYIDSLSLSDSKKESIIKGIEKVILKNYPGSKVFNGFESRIDAHINEKVTGERSKFTTNIPDTYVVITFDREPTTEIIKEIIQIRIDRLRESGLPVTPDRYFTKFVERDGKTFLVVALDETYIYPRN